MLMDPVTQFDNQDFLNLETFRKNGDGVATPVWFVEDRGVFYVRTGNNSGKVKRIRNSGWVRIVPCSSRGKPLGEWVEAEARLVDGELADKVNRLLKKKNRYQKTMFDLMGKLNKLEPATIEIKILKN